MLKQVSLFIITLAFALVAYTTQAQQAAEIFIPIGKSPGISNQNSILGNIKSVDSQRNSIIVSNDSGTYTVKISADTQIWLDNSKSGKTNQTGTRADCQPGRRVEVKYVDANNKANVGTAKWIKVEME